MKLRIGQAGIAIERGDITDWEVDAVVNAANTNLMMNAGVAATIKKKGGIVIEEEATRQGPVEVGEAVLTSGGNLMAQQVIHAAVMDPDVKLDAATVARATATVLALADKHRIASLAMPAFATGAGRLPPAESAQAMIETVVNHLKSGKSTVRRVIFVLYQDDAYRAFTTVLQGFGAG